MAGVVTPKTKMIADSALMLQGQDNILYCDMLEIKITP